MAEESVRVPDTLAHWIGLKLLARIVLSQCLDSIVQVWPRENLVARCVAKCPSKFP